MEQLRQAGVEEVNIQEYVKDRVIDLEQQKGGMMARSLKDVVSTMGQSIGDLVTSFKDGFDGIGDAFVSMLNNMLSSLMDAVTQMAMSGLMNWLFPSGGGSGALVAGPVAGYIGGLGPRASGGPTEAGKAYIVGEKGPEVFLSKSSGTVIPNDKLGGGGVQNIRVQVINEGDQKVRSTNATGRFDGRELIVSVWIDAYQRDTGGLRTMLGGGR
jgi:hypothetical protein